MNSCQHFHCNLCLQRGLTAIKLPLGKNPAPKITWHCKSSAVQECLCVSVCLCTFVLNVCLIILSTIWSISSKSVWWIFNSKFHLHSIRDEFLKKKTVSILCHINITFYPISLCNLLKPARMRLLAFTLNSSHYLVIVAYGCPTNPNKDHWILKSTICLLHFLNAHTKNDLSQPRKVLKGLTV